MEPRRMESRKKVDAFKVKNIDIKQITFDKLLGWGAFGEVHLGTWENTACAIKYFNIYGQFYNAEAKRSFDDELKSLTFLSERNAPNIIKMYGVVDVPFNCIVLEYAPNNDLQYHIDYATDFPRNTRYDIMIEATEAIRFMHALDFLHSDIKPANILLAADFHAKLCDFGLSISCEDARKKCIRSGTETFMAPEILASSTAYVTKCSDMYSWGLTFWSVLNKKHPFDGLDSHEAQMKKTSGAPEPITKIHNRRVAQLFQACWCVEPEKRPSAERALKILTKARDHKPSAKK